MKKKWQYITVTVNSTEQTYTFIHSTDMKKLKLNI